MRPHIHAAGVVGNDPGIQPGSAGSIPARRSDVLRRKDWRVEDVPLASCKRLVEAEHYARKGSYLAVFRHGLMRRDDPLRVRGIAWWIPPTRNAAGASWDGDWRAVLSLSRLAIEPDVPCNAASFLLGASVRLIRGDGRWRCLVTYADERLGHTGAIYLAAGWEYVGTVLGDPTYVDNQGRTVARQDGSRGGGRTQQEMLALGYRRLGCYPKRKFRLLLPERRQTRHLTQMSLLWGKAAAEELR